MDMNHDGVISLEDLENLAVRYLCGEELMPMSEEQPLEGK